MKILKYASVLLIYLLFSSISVQGQEKLNLTPQQMEKIFVEQNLNVIAERMNIDIADAEIAQAKLWDNPELSIGDINFWSSSNQRDGEDIPGVWGNFPKNTQFNVELSQLIVTANKKGKEVGLAKKQKEISIEEFEDFLRNLKAEFRTQIFELIYLQDKDALLNKQKETLDKMIAVFKKQFEMGNLAKTELLRLQSANFEIAGEQLENTTELLEKEKEIKTLLCVDPNVQVLVNKEEQLYPTPESINITTLIEEMLVNRPDLKKDQLEINMLDKTIDLEKAQRVPDLNLSVAYDRRGGVWKNYVGVGVSFDIPLLNRNQGAIKSAKYQKQQSQIQSRQNILEAHNEAIEAYKNYQNTYRLYKELQDNDLLKDLEEIYTSYEKNLMKKNISMLEFIDFFETYQSNKELMISAYKNMSMTYENLQKVLFTEIK